MSLINQIRIAFFLVIIATAGGSLVFSTLDSKNYLTEEMQKKDADNANVLALSMSQMDKDSTTIDLFISAQFDAGHYRYIGLFDPAGKLITERVNANSATIAPLFFTKLFPIKTAPGFANVQSGWKQYGSINVQSDVNFAYDKLWNAVKNMLIWVLSIGLITYIVCGVLLKKILRPLDDVIAQATAIGEHRFITTQEPKTLEFKAVVYEMNALSNRIKNNVQAESERLDALRFKNNYDEITGLMNRDFFVNTMDARMQQDDFSQGGLLIFRLSNLAEIDRTIGYVKTNAFLKKVGSLIESQTLDNANLHAGRIGSTDFAMFSSKPIDEFSLANTIRMTICQVPIDADFTELSTQFLSVATKTKKMDESKNLFKILDFILDISALSEENYLRVVNANSVTASEQQYLSEWRGLLENALAHKRIKLEHYPVVNQLGTLIHYESPVRLQLTQDGKWLSAGEFINWAIQLDLIKTIDTMALETAVAILNQDKKPICLNVSESAMRNADYLSTVSALIKRHVKEPQLLSFEVPEIAAFNHLSQFRHFCNALKTLGCCVGIEHVSLRIARLGELHDIGLDYIKFDASLVRNIHTHETNQSLLRGLCMIMRSIGISPIAEGVSSQEEVLALKEIGMDGMTGPAIKHD